MAQPTINRFTKGLNSDVSLTDRAQDTFLDAHNVRLSRREEGSLWAANIKGNEETFELSDGFIPIGSKEFDGYLFIMSVRSSDGECEIGSYPAPTSTGIQRIYRPLQNYSPVDIILDTNNTCLSPEISGLSSFRSTKLNFRCDKPIRMEIRLDFDGSVNLYWTDDYNPWRVINNGFILSTGQPNNRYVTQSMIESGFINGINESDKIPVLDMVSTPTGGQLKIGQYFIFARYANLNYVTTSFLGQSGPIPIVNQPTLGQIVTSGGEAQELTDRLINIIVSNLDTTIDFVELGFIRYFAQDQYEAFLIDKRYPILGLTSKLITITGSEPLLPLTLDELVVSKPSDALYCKDLTQAQNILYLANTYGPQLDHPDLRDFMCALELQESLDNNGSAPVVDASANINPYAVNTNQTEENVGYFSGETYVFAVVPIFKGGFRGQPMPLTGYDNYNGLLANPNKNGIYRFKKSHIANFWDGTDTYIKGIEVLVTPAAITIYNNSSWLQQNLIGVEIARGDRNQNLLYQGISLRCYNGHMNPKCIRWDASLPGSINDPRNVRLMWWRNSNGDYELRWDPTGPIYSPDPDDYYSGRTVPLFEPSTYSLISPTDNSEETAENRTKVKLICYGHPIFYDERNDLHDKTKLGIFSVDYYIDNTDISESVHIEMIGTTDYYNDWRRECTAFNTIPITTRSGANMFRYSALDNDTRFWPFDSTCKAAIPASNRGSLPTFVGYNQLNITYTTNKFLAAIVNVPSWQVNPVQSFTSRFSEGKIASQDGLYYYVREDQTYLNLEWEISMPCALPSYIGVKNAPQYNPPLVAGKYDHFVDSWDRAIVNVYTTDPDNIIYTNYYDFKNTEFYPISSFIDIQTFLTTPTHKSYRGDCIISRSYLKIYNASINDIGEAFSNHIAHVDESGNSLYDYDYIAESQEFITKGFGHWVSIVTEQKYNASYRTELGRNLFYPRTSPLEPGKDFAWLYDSPESNFYNKGYAEYLGPKAQVGIDVLQNISNNKFPTRIRPSITHIFGAVRDGYRQFIPADAKDFDYSFGEIQAIVSIMDMLYSFQNRAINLHPINERITQQGTQGSTAVLGESSGLTQFRQIVKQGYGTQHRFGVVVANQALYCIDWNKRAILRIGGQEVQILDINKSVQSWFRNIVSLGSTGYSDVLEQLPNAHPCGKGIHGIYNKKYKEVLWTLRLGEVDKTIAFSEEMDCFLGTRGYKPIHYAQVEEDLYSFVDKKAWLHDANVKYNTFYGTLDNWLLRFVVNESAELTKHFDNLIINSNNRVFASIKFETQHQTANQTPFLPTVEFWYAPTYRENEWRLPIRRADNIKNTELNIYDDFTTDKTPMRGKYLIIELEYNQDKELWIREIITFYNQSFT